VKSRSYEIPHYAKFSLPPVMTFFLGSGITYSDKTIYGRDKLIKMCQSEEKDG
jgi:hypothetical protein